jgi:anti-sigma B factor antagonist
VVAERFALALSRQPGLLEAIVSGEIDLASAPELERAVLDVLDGEALDVVLVLTDVTFIDSSGLLACVTLRDAAAARGCRLRLARPSDRVVAVLELAGLVDVFDIDR